MGPRRLCTPRLSCRLVRESSGESRLKSTFEFLQSARQIGDVCVVDDGLSIMSNAPLVFISYRRVDSSAASRWLAESIARTFGAAHVFIDTESIRMGDAWPERIDSALSSATIVLPVIGPSWLRIPDENGRRRLDKPDDWVCNEIRHALQRGLPIIPLLLSPPPQTPSQTLMPSREALPEPIQNLSRMQGLNYATIAGRAILQRSSRD
jgi:hypothetical protein